MSANHIILFLTTLGIVPNYAVFQHPVRTNPAALYTLPDSYVLSELPLSALLKVKKSVNEIICLGYPEERASSCPAVDGPKIKPKNETDLGFPGSAVPVPDNDDGDKDQPSSRTLSDLKSFFTGGGAEHQSASSDEWPDNRKTYHEHGLWKGGGGSEESGKIQKLFQFSVTALAFLAFGGYLLCMIVQAIKSKGTVYYHPSSTYTTAFKKKKPIYSYGKRRRRRRSNADETWDEYPPNMSLENNSDLDMMYNGLISAIGAYVNVTYAPA